MGSVASRRQFDRLTEGFQHAAFISDALASDSKCSAMVDRRTNHWQPDRNINAGFQTHGFHWPVSLVMIHGQHKIEVATGCLDKCACAVSRTGQTVGNTYNPSPMYACVMQLRRLD